MIPRTLEPEAMDTPEEALEYDLMDHSTVNERFAQDFLRAHKHCQGGWILDVGTGTARIPIAIAQADSKARLIAADLSEPMLEIGRRNVADAGLSDRIILKKVDAKGFDEPDRSFEAVISNSIVHHIPNPQSVMAEMSRLVAPRGTLFCRDLARPDTVEQLENLVRLYASEESDRARSLFEASLHAALTLEEVRAIVEELGLPADGVTMTSDRHWTWVWRAP